MMYNEVIHVLRSKTKQRSCEAYDADKFYRAHESFSVFSSKNSSAIQNLSSNMMYNYVILS